MEHFGTAVFSRAVSFREYSADEWRDENDRPRIKSVCMCCIPYHDL